MVTATNEWINSMITWIISWQWWLQLVWLKNSNTYPIPSKVGFDHQESSDANTNTMVDNPTSGPTVQNQWSLKTVRITTEGWVVENDGGECVCVHVCVCVCVWKHLVITTTYEQKVNELVYPQKHIKLGCL